MVKVIADFSLEHRVFSDLFVLHVDKMYSEAACSVQKLSLSVCVCVCVCACVCVFVCTNLIFHGSFPW
jgi:hypothetical protein